MWLLYITLCLSLWRHFHRTWFFAETHQDPVDLISEPVVRTTRSYENGRKWPVHQWPPGWRFDGDGCFIIIDWVCLRWFLIFPLHKQSFWDVFFSGDLRKSDLLFIVFKPPDVLNPYVGRRFQTCSFFWRMIKGSLEVLTSDYTESCR